MIQGITEWLPISSEGISSLVMINFFKKSASEAIPTAIWLHSGTLLAALVYFRKEVIEILRNLPGYVKNVRKPSPTNKLTSFLMIATFFSAAIGAPMMLFSLDKLSFRGDIATAAIGFFLIITGALQFLGSRKKFIKNILIKDSVLVGIVQAFAVLPGLSRSGLTTAALLFRKYTAKQALKLSFLMSIPLVFVAEVGLGLLKMIEFDVYSLAAVLISFVSGLLTISLLIRAAEKINFGYFCLSLGILSFIPLLI
jgi:undecaprenyl-diphosphatase